MENSGIIISRWLEKFYDEVEPKEFYRAIFPAGALDKRGAFTPGAYTGIIVAVTDKKKADGKTKIKRYTLTDELEELDQVTSSEDFCICAPVSYAGKQRTAENARYLYAFAVDVDKIAIQDGEPLGLKNMLERHVDMLQILPKPTFIVSSGNGIHVYYVLEEPIPLYAGIAKELQAYKRELTRRLWHFTITDIKTNKEIQQEGIYQGLRMPGTITKNGSRARAFDIGGGKVTMEYLNSFVDDEYKALTAQKKEQAQKKRKVTLETAKQRWPEWYERRIINKQPPKKWATNRSVYMWWRRQVVNAEVGHRYYYILALAIYARKCSVFDPEKNPNPVTREELEKDAYGFIDLLESKTDDDNNHFGADDVQPALEAFDDKWVTYPREALEYLTGIAIQANKRNGRKQADHIKLMNFVRDEINNNTEWHGRKPKDDIVRRWRRQHPDGIKAECIRETGLDKKTVYKYWG